MKRYHEKTLRRYVLATIDKNGKSYFLYKVPQKIEYIITENIELSSKAVSLSTANMLLDFYYQDMGTEIQFVPIPIEINYDILEEE